MNGWQLFLQQLANGLTIGSIYALIALGYTMVYGVIQLINFAHGEIFIVGAYIALSVLLFLGVSQAVSGFMLIFVLVICVAAGVAFCGALGFGIERVAYKPLRNSPRLIALITAIGISFFLQNALMLIFGATDKHFPSVIPSIKWEISGVTVTGLQIIIWVSSALLMVGLHILVMRTKLGTAMRAVSQDIKACRLLGIPVDRIIALTFIIGSALASVGGTLFGLYYNTINFHDGYMTGLKAFTAAVIGGIGNITGAMVGGVVLGVLESLGAGYLSAQWKNVFAFVVLVVLLLFRPTGIFGERVSDRA
jgi:branched-chain amino acid transport system permease protein